LGGAYPLHVRRPGQGAADGALSAGRRSPAGADALPHDGGDVPPCSRPAGGGALHARRREGAAEGGDPRRQPRDLHRAREPVRNARGGAGQRTADAFRRGGDPARGQRRDHRRRFPDGDHGPARRRGARRPPRDRGGGDRPPHAAPAGPRHDHRVRPQDQPRGRGGGGLAARRGWRQPRGADPGAGVRLPGRPDPTGHRRRRADAVLESAGTGRDAPRRARSQSSVGDLPGRVMAVDVTMPRLSDSMEEGTVLRWLKSVGDEVKRGDELVEIETDKANMTYEATDEGTLVEILADEGATLPIGEPIARIGDASEASGDGRPAKKEPERP